MNKRTIAATDLYLDKGKSTAVLEGPDAAFLLRRAGREVPREYQHLVGRDGYPLGYAPPDAEPPAAVSEPGAAKPKPKAKPRKKAAAKKPAAKGRSKAPATKEVKPGEDK